MKHPKEYWHFPECSMDKNIWELFIPEVSDTQGRSVIYPCSFLLCGENYSLDFINRTHLALTKGRWEVVNTTILTQIYTKFREWIQEGWKHQVHILFYFIFSMLLEFAKHNPFLLFIFQCAKLESFIKTQITKTKFYIPFHWILLRIIKQNLFSQ